MSVDLVLDGAAAAVREAERRSRGEAPDRRFDVPLAMLEDLADEIENGPRDEGATVEGTIRAAMSDILDQARAADRAIEAGCTGEVGCSSSLHLLSCPGRR